ncbi:GntR family transcriptional regulator [Poseidonocella sp. HB161398]|uniref:GntR family transcriptional regulator n=1 Tax=Poseidonocella sp. HB161398 TaxID=2320855 RepID=UPI00110816E7|nr:GntR family transcriptional regulator [Poseidonocella sp. HB161398]
MSKGAAETMQRGIETTLLSAIVEGRLHPGSRLSENQLAEAFEVSRTLVREALARLEARHIISVRPRRGWFVNRPSPEEAAAVFAARRAVEYGFFKTAAPFNDDQIARLKAHIAEERAAIEQGDKAQLTFLMGDFHTRIIALSGNEPLEEVMRNLTARTILISLRYQSSAGALASHRDHCDIADAISRGDMDAAAELSLSHLEDVESGLLMQEPADPLVDLRNTLRLDPVQDGRAT